MTRAILLASLLLGACTVGEVNTNQGGGSNNPGIDADTGSNIGIDAPGSGSGSANACVNRATPGTPHLHGGAGGPTHAGEGCLQAACHGNGGAGPQFQFAGTIYKKGTNTPDPGAVIVVTPDNPAIPPVQLVADTAGNFNITPTTGAMPASTHATACPDITPMTAKLTGNSTPGKGGDCNACHNGTTTLTLSTN